MNKDGAVMTPNDMEHLHHCLRLAREALDAGDAPFGSVLVSVDNKVIAESRNRIHEINALAHPEFDLARWAIENLTEEERKNTMMYTSGEHCPMCAAAHGWAGLGSIVYLSSARQLEQWREEVSAPKAPIHFIPIEKILPFIAVKGPATGPLLEEIKALQMAYLNR